MRFLLDAAAVTEEATIRETLAAACEQRGVQAEISKAFDVHPSTVKRWVEGGEIPPPMLKLLDWYFFGTVPPRLNGTFNLRGSLEFTEDEWRIIGLMAARAGQSHAAFIRTTILAIIHSATAEDFRARASYRSIDAVPDLDRMGSRLNEQPGKAAP